MILLKDKLSCRSERQVTAGSKVTTGPTQLRETFSVAIKGRDSSSVGRDWSWLPWRSSRVKLFKLCQIERKKNPLNKRSVWFDDLSFGEDAEHLPDKALRETPEGYSGSGPGEGDDPGGPAPSRCPLDKTECPARFPTDPAVGSAPALWAKNRDSPLIQTLDETEENTSTVVEPVTQNKEGNKQTNRIG